jgi:hypothetical protein
VTVHILLGGASLCVFTTDIPAVWPEGHSWVSIDDDAGATCAGCLAAKEAAKDLGPEGPTLIQIRLILQKQATAVARDIERGMPPHTGFAFFVFDFGEGRGRGNLAWYVSNAKRPDVVRLLREWMVKEGGRS